MKIFLGIVVVLAVLLAILIFQAKIDIGQEEKHERERGKKRKEEEARAKKVSNELTRKYAEEIQEKIKALTPHFDGLLAMMNQGGKAYGPRILAAKKMMSMLPYEWSREYSEILIRLFANTTKGDSLLALMTLARESFIPFEILRHFSIDKLREIANAAADAFCSLRGELEIRPTICDFLIKFAPGNSNLYEIDKHLRSKIKELNIKKKDANLWVRETTNRQRNRDYF